MCRNERTCGVSIEVDIETLSCAQSHQLYGSAIWLLHELDRGPAEGRFAILTAAVLSSFRHQSHNRLFVSTRRRRDNLGDFVACSAQFGLSPPAEKFSGNTRLAAGHARGGFEHRV